MGLNMIKQILRPKKRKTIFICSITENSLKVIKCLNNHSRDFVGLEVEKIPPGIDDKALAEKLNQVFKKLEYNNNPVVFSLTRNQATCRYLKVPTQTPQEIEKIVSLQASRYLPYSANELITAYQAIKTDEEGYSHINLVIVHKDVVERYLKIFNALKVTRLCIILSSYGLCNFYNYIGSKDTRPAIIVDIDSNNVELAIVSNQKLLFSRYFKLNRTQPNWENLFVDEIKKTNDAYAKEVSLELPYKIILLGTGKNAQEFIGVVNKQAQLPVEVLSYSEKIRLSQELLNSMLNSEYSFVSLVGLGLEVIEESLNILPPDIKEKQRKLTQYKERLRRILFISGIVVIWFLAIAKNLDNKTKYLVCLKAELSKIAKEAEPLEEIEKRFDLLQKRAKKKPTSLDLFYELHKIMPDEISLVNLNYEEDNQVTLKGQTIELNSVFSLVSQLEKSAVFRNFTVKVRYATKRKTQAGEIVDFEIVCTKK